MEDINHALTGGSSPLFTDMLIRKPENAVMDSTMMDNSVTELPKSKEEIVKTGGDPTIKVIKLINRDTEQGGKYLSSDMPNDFNELPM